MKSYVIITNNSVVATSDNEYGAIDYAIKINPNAIYLPFAKEEDVLSDNQYKDGFYIIADVRTSMLLEKIKVILPGYVYNTELFEVKKHKSWTILSISDNIQTINANSLNKDTDLITGSIKELSPVPNSPISITNPDIHKGLPVPKLYNNMDSVGPKPPPPPPKKISNLDNDKGVINITKPCVSIPLSNNLPDISLEHISKCPSILSIGIGNNLQKEKIESIIHKNFSLNKIRENNLIIITKGSEDIEYWAKKFPESFIYNKLDNDIIYHLSNDHIFNNEKISKIVVFDQSLNMDFVQNKQFNTFLSMTRKNNIGIIVITRNIEIICHSITNNLEYILIHTITNDWEKWVSEYFSNNHLLAVSQRYLDSHIVKTTRNNKCLTIYNKNLYQL